MKNDRTAVRTAAWAVFAAALLWLGACTSNDHGLKYSYLRSASDFGVDTAVGDAHCSEPQPAFKNDTALCRRTKKFILHWERPEDTAGFIGYRIYLDTAFNGRRWINIQKDDNLASIAVLDVAKDKDTLVFFLTEKGIDPRSQRPDTLNASRSIIAVDSVGRDTASKFVFALATRYKDGGTQGQPRYTELITNDRFPPDPFSPRFTAGARSISIAWARPSDPVSIFNPRLDSGMIAGYVLQVRLSGVVPEKRGAAFAPSLTYLSGATDRSKQVTDSTLHKGTVIVGRAYFLPDSDHAHRANPAGDSLRAEISGLTPQDELVVTLYAVDSSGNNNDPVMQDVTIRTTDTTRPETPHFQQPVDSVTHNSFVVRWSASSDSVAEEPGGALRAANPNHFIKEYRLSRFLVRDSTQRPSPLDRLDTIVAVEAANAADTSFQVAFRFLPPGTPFLLTVTAVDSSGFASFSDTARVTTDSVRFTDAESSFTCPQGFVPIPGHAFTLGEAGGTGDEQGGRTFMRSYCIEPYEHSQAGAGLDSLARFVSGVTWEEADSICRAMSPTDMSALCSEAEWERACEGFDSLPHLHGIQSETSPLILQTSCNQATGDSVMAMNLALRNSVCLTDEGVYDMAGNLSEWVRDPYVPNAYQSMSDTLSHADAFSSPAPLDSLLRGFRGGNYIKPPTLPLAQAQSLARCSNRDYAQQVRPLYKPECVDSATPSIAVVYGPGLAGVRCLPLDTLEGKPITDIAPDRDSTKLMIFLAGSSKILIYSIPQDDSTFRGKRPQSAQLTTRSLAEVVFVDAGTGREIRDSIDAREMKDTSQAALARIFQREAVSSRWSVKKEDGRFAVKLLYAYTILGSRPARPYYASRAIGFRCCSNPRPPATPVAGP